VSVSGLESNQFYYNPLTQQLFTISKTCLRKQTGLTERLIDEPMEDKAQTVLPVLNHQMDNSRPVRLKPNPGRTPQQESSWVRKSIAFLVACYCGMVVYSRFLLRGRSS
jgi:hypothetical protein